MLGFYRVQLSNIFYLIGREHMVEMLDTYHRLSQKDIENVELKTNIKLTDSYREFLLKWNGGDS